MFSTSLSLLLLHLGAYIILPLIIGIFGMWTITGNRFRGLTLYILSGFLGIGTIGYGMFLLQFVRFGIDWVAYAILLALVIILCLIRAKYSRFSWKNLIDTLRVSYSLGKSHEKRTLTYKIIAILLALFVLIFIVASFYFVTHFPTYADDAFGNWHLPVINMLYDGGAHIFGEMSEILGRGRLGYPIMIPTLQAFVSNIL